VGIADGGAEGVLFAHGSLVGGHSLYVKNNRLHNAYNFVGSFDQKGKEVTDRVRRRADAHRSDK